MTSSGGSDGFDDVIIPSSSLPYNRPDESGNGGVWLTGKAAQGG
jgi:hypothetical protein